MSIRIKNKKSLKNSITFIIFSKDRPLQLHALLFSLANNTDQITPVIVLYKATTDIYFRQYHEVFKNLEKNIRVLAIHEDYSFKYHLDTILQIIQTSFISFLVDDIIFIRPFSISTIVSQCRRGFVVSLRLGVNITYSYMMNINENIPEFTKNKIFLVWKWSEGGIDWKYPLSVDGNVFRKNDIIPLISSISYKSPNTLEQNLQSFNYLYLQKKGACFERSVIVNIPANKVQEDYLLNRSGEISPHELAIIWDSGMRIEIERLQNITTNSVHMEYSYHFIKR